MRTGKIISLISIIIFLAFQNITYTSCSKPEDNPTDTISSPPPPPPPPPADTITLVRKLEVITSLYPSYVLVPNRTFSFYYDNQKRVSSIGIKNYSSLFSDSATTRFFYTGSSLQPSLIIMADIKSQSTGPVSYDTCWLSYSVTGKLLKDSVNERVFHYPTGSFIRKPLVRQYNYPTATTAKIDWMGSFTSTGPEGLLRRDTIAVTSSGNIDRIKAHYTQDPSYGLSSYALAHGFTFSSIVNPLSKLNISGTPFSLIYTDVKNEILGNQYHPLVYNSNGFAEYIDFISPVIPSLFYIGAYNRFGQMIGSSGAAFVIDFSTWPLRPSYPAELRVSISSSLAGDRFFYRYYY